MAEVSSPYLAEHKTEYSTCDSDYGSQENGMGIDENLKTEAASAYSSPNKPKAPSKDIKAEDLSDEDDVPLHQRFSQVSNDSHKKRKKEDIDDDYKPEKKVSKNQKTPKIESDDDVPLAERLNKSKDKKKDRKRKQSESDDDHGKPKKKKDRKKEKEKSSKDKKVKEEVSSPTKRKKKEEELEDVWEWWKEEKKPAGVKWNTLVHHGPLFAPDYITLPDHVKFKYDGHIVKLSNDAEEVATFYARMLDHEYTSKDAFNNNFFKDWRKQMTAKEREMITDLKKCDFRQMEAYFKEQTEIRKAMTKEEKLKIKEEKEAEGKIYGFAYIDGHKQKVANFRIEPPGLFRGRGGHPKMGMLKKRVRPEDVIINCSKGGEIPRAPAGHNWKEVRHDNQVTWLCSWTENVLGQNKYIMLNPSSKIKGEKDYEKYETARRLKSRIKVIRENYTADWKSKEMRIRQRAVALYFIDKLALRAGNEKDVDEAADTVGCCSLRCEHIKLHEKINDKEYVVEFDFLGKDSIRYYNQVPVEKRVFKNLQLFMENKDPGDDLFDRLDTTTLNEHLRSLMPGLTVKVFRTYNASITLQEQLNKLTNKDDNVHQKMLSYNRANRQVAILCNHQRAVPKTHEKSMENLENKIKDKKAELKQAKKELDGARGKDVEKLKKRVDRLKEQLKKLKISRTDKDENKQIALSTSKLNYLDPRISIAWCKKYDVPIEKVFNKTQREKFRWAIDMTMSNDEEYIF
ncbi:unnamed protein product [Auanema sp. JU1783]|nr:unnamed protein product [Auanema sp. JU1783]